VKRGSSSSAAVAGGLVGALLFAAFGDFQCKDCGKIPKSEFPEDVRSQMTRGSVMMVVIAFIVLALVICALAFLK
jgi:hypothetical protein